MGIHAPLNAWQCNAVALPQGYCCRARFMLRMVDRIAAAAYHFHPP
jgi:hypothetical protein